MDEILNLRHKTAKVLLRTAASVSMCVFILIKIRNVQRRETPDNVVFLKKSVKINPPTIFVLNLISGWQRYFQISGGESFTSLQTR